MVAISNIIAGSSVLGLANQEGKILIKTFWPLVVYCLIGGLVGFFLI
jgi:L-lactate permease